MLNTRCWILFSNTFFHDGANMLSTWTSLCTNCHIEQLGAPDGQTNLARGIRMEKDNRWVGSHRHKPLMGGLCKPISQADRLTKYCISQTCFYMMAANTYLPRQVYISHLLCVVNNKTSSRQDISSYLEMKCTVAYIFAKQRRQHSGDYASKSDSRVFYIISSCISG